MQLFAAPEAWLYIKFFCLITKHSNDSLRSATNLKLDVQLNMFYVCSYDLFGPMISFQNNIISIQLARGLFNSAAKTNIETYCKTE